jgi:hypothetical protein
MPLFVHPETGQFVLTSYKAMYSQFEHSPNWKTLGYKLTPRLVVHMVRRGGLSRAKLIVRNPYDRTVSCFTDKFRSQPRLIHEPDFQWQACHRVVFPLVGLSGTEPNEVIAGRLLNWPFADFVHALPHLEHREGHFFRQDRTRRITVPMLGSCAVPFLNVVRMEDREVLNDIPGINFSEKRHSTSHIPRDFEWTDDLRSVIRDVYRADFRLGRYSTEPC